MHMIPLGIRQPHNLTNSWKIKGFQRCAFHTQPQKEQPLYREPPEKIKAVRSCKNIMRMLRRWTRYITSLHGNSTRYFSPRRNSRSNSWSVRTTRKHLNLNDRLELFWFWGNSQHPLVAEQLSSADIGAKPHWTLSKGEAQRGTAGSLAPIHSADRACHIGLGYNEAGMQTPEYIITTGSELQILSKKKPVRFSHQDGASNIYGIRAW